MSSIPAQPPRSATLHAVLRDLRAHFDRRHMAISTPGNCLACGKALPIPHSIAMHFCPSCSADPARTIKAETGLYLRRSDTLRSGVKVDRLVQDFKRHGSIRRIAKQYGLSRLHVTRLLRRKGCVTDQRRLKAAAKRDRIVQAFREHPSMKWVSRHTHSSGDYVRAVLQEAGFETPKVQRKIEDWKGIIDLYNGGLSTRAIGQQFRVGDETIRRGLLRRGITMRPNTAHLSAFHANQQRLARLGMKLQDAGRNPRKMLRAMLRLYFTVLPDATPDEVRMVFNASDDTVARAKHEAEIPIKKGRPGKVVKPQLGSPNK